MSFKKKISMFMVFLVLTIPLYSVSVLATFSNIRVSGQQEIEGYYRGPDYQQDLQPDVVRVDLFAEDGGVPITERVRVRFSSTPAPGDMSASNQFTDCDPQGNCHYTTSADLGDRRTLYLYQFSTTGAWEGSYDIPLTKDRMAADIQQYSITPEVVTTSNVTISFEVRDYAYSTSMPTLCSGIERIVFARNTFSKTYENVTEPEDCYFQDSFEVDISELGSGADHETITILMTVYDRVGHVSEATASFDIDLNAPTVDSSSFTIQKDNEDIEFLREAISGAEIGFKMEAPEQDLATVIVDVSQINKNAPLSYTSKDATCTDNGNGVYDCSITGLTVDINQSMVVSIFVNATDSLGNKMANVGLSKQLYYDITGPAVQGIRTDRVFDNLAYLGHSGDVIVEFEETGSGVSEVFIDLSAVGGSSNHRTENCTSSGSTWLCTWYNLTPTSSGTKAVSVKTTTKDSIGNDVTGELSGSIIVDLSNPRYSSHTIVNKGIEPLENVFKAGDAMQIEITVTDDTGITSGIANLSMIIEDEDALAGSMIEQNGNSYTYRWITDPINIPGHISDEMAFVFTDTSGNTVDVGIPIDILGISFNATGEFNYWKSKVSCTPNLIDRSIATLINQKTYCHVTLSKTNPSLDAEPVSLALGQCEDNHNSSTISMIQNAESMNMHPGSTDPYILLTIAQTEATVDKIDIKCPIQILSRVGENVTGTTETEWAEVEIGLYNNILGDVDESIKTKIEDVNEFNEGIWKFVGILKKIISYIKLICRALNTISKLKLAMGFLTNKVTLAHIGASKSPAEPLLAATKSSTCTADKALEKVDKQSFKALEGLCKFVNCQASDDSSKGTWGEISEGIKNQKNRFYSGYEKFSTIAPGIGQPDATDTSGRVAGFFSKDPASYLNAEDSLIIAVGTMCIPAIISNVDKYRQLNCMYGSCMITAHQTNVPISVCEEQKSYMTCKYITGEIFAVVPFVNLLFHYLGMIRSAISDPLSAIGILASMFCKPAVVSCEASVDASISWASYAPACNAVTFVTMFAEIVGDIQGFMDGGFKVQDDFCETFDSAYEEEFGDGEDEDDGGLF
jgi:hypothetical protein